MKPPAEGTPRNMEWKVEHIVNRFYGVQSHENAEWSWAYLSVPGEERIWVKRTHNIPVNRAELIAADKASNLKEVVERILVEAALCGEI